MDEKVYQLRLVITAETVTLSTPKGSVHGVAFNRLHDPEGREAFLQAIAKECLKEDEDLCKWMGEHIAQACS